MALIDKRENAKNGKMPLANQSVLGALPLAAEPIHDAAGNHFQPVSLAK
jgi:hypothetical protein